MHNSAYILYQNGGFLSRVLLKNVGRKAAGQDEASDGCDVLLAVAMERCNAVLGQSVWGERRFSLRDY